MSIKTIYICDRCKAEQATQDQMWQIHVQINHYGHAQPKFYPHTQPAALWCRKCVDEVQLIGTPVAKPEATPPVVVMTLEEKLREIIQDELQAFQP